MKPVWDEKEDNSKRFVDTVINAGEYTGKIKKVEWIQSEYMINQYNPDGDCLSVWVDVEGEEFGTKRLFDKISITNPSKLNSLRTAAGLSPVKRGDNFDEKDLRGRVIEVEVDEYTSKSGKVSNIIKSYSPSLPAEKPNQKSVPF